jgi:short subunit dehydrogenase-like uncharacterized protein
MQFDLMIYGSYGYTGSLMAKRMLDAGYRILIAGRDARALRSQCDRIGVHGAVFSLGERKKADDASQRVPLVLNCAGPFVHTAPPLVEACLRAGTHYLDITGEPRVIESLAERDAAARSRGVMILPGMGFDVVPGDCLACHLKRRLPSATHLSLAFRSRGRPSRGTVRSALMHADEPGMIREAGELKGVPAGSISRRIDFGDGERHAVAIPWGELASAYYSTGVANIVTYMAAPRYAGTMLTLAGKLSRLLAARPAQAALSWMTRLLPPGPNARQRGEGSTRFWGEARDEAGGHQEARLAAMEAYDLTVEAILAAVGRILGGGATPGFVTPAMAFGPGFAASLPGVSWIDKE